MIEIILKKYKYFAIIEINCTKTVLFSLLLEKFSAIVELNFQWEKTTK